MTPRDKLITSLSIRQRRNLPPVIQPEGSITPIKTYNRQLSIIRGKGGEKRHRQPKIMVKTKALKRRYKMDLL
jgi:hypothetical protein